MTNRLLPLAALPLLAACQGNSAIWLIQVAAIDPDEGSSCETTCTENFDEASCPEDSTSSDSDWTYTYTYAVSDALFFAQIEHTAEGAVLIINGTVFPGTKENGDWVFAWDQEREEKDRAEHDAGYEYLQVAADTSSSTFTFSGSGGTAEGTVNEKSISTASYEESDEWSSDDVGVYYGQIPADYWLEMDDEEDWSSPENDPENDDCDGDSCKVALNSTCTIDTTFTATRTSYADEDAFDYLSGVTQSGG